METRLKEGVYGMGHEIGPRDRSWTVNSPGSFRVSQNIFALSMYNNLLMKLLSNSFNVKNEA